MIKGDIALFKYVVVLNIDVNNINTKIKKTC